MAYVDDFKVSNTSITWNGIVYYPVTDWTYSSDYANLPSGSYTQNTRAAVRFLMAATSSMDNNIIIAQYSAYTPSGTMYRGSGYYLMRRLNSTPGDSSQTEAISQGTIISTADIDIRLWPWNTTNDHQVQEGHLIWPDRPYILRSVGTLASGASRECMRFYIKDTDPDFRDITPNIAATYTAPYKVIFNANGGSGSVATVAKKGGSTITLPTSASFSKTNYNLLGFSTNSSATTADYAPGSTYTVSSNVTLYAVWSLAQNYITYNANSPTSGTPTNIPARQTKQPNVAITLSSTVPSGTNLNPPYNFVSWNTAADGLGTSYSPGATYSSNIDLNLYAIWSNNYTGKESRISSLTVYRAVKNGSTYTEDKYGEYLVFSGRLRVYAIDGYNNSYNKITVGSSPSISIPNVTSFTSAGSGTDTRGSYTEYSFEYKSTSAILSSGTAYNLTFTPIDAYQNYYSGATRIPVTRTIEVAFITFSTNGKGKSAAFGTEAKSASSLTGTDATVGRLDVKMNTYFTGNAAFSGTVTGIPLPSIATTSAAGIVKPDGSTITVDSSGKISAVQQTCTENSGGTTWEQCLSISSGSGVGWREEKYSDGRLRLWMWDWFTVNSTSFDKTFTWPTGPTPFADMPTWSHSIHANGVNMSLDLVIKTITKNSTFDFRCTRTGNNGVMHVAFCFDGHWQ